MEKLLIIHNLLEIHITNLVTTPTTSISVYLKIEKQNKKRFPTIFQARNSLTTPTFYTR